MAVTAKQDGTFQGNLNIGTDFLSQTYPVYLDILAAIVEDVVAAGISIDVQPASIYWYLHLYTNAELSRLSKFKSSLPKFDLGDVQFINQGQRTSGEFWNFSSQRFAPQTCWSLQSTRFYPSEYTPLEDIGTANILGLNLFDSNTVLTSPFNYADSLQLQLFNADLTGVQIWLYYQGATLEYSPPLALLGI